MSYESLIAAIVEVDADSRMGAAAAVSRHHTLRNWLIGAYIVEFEQNGAERASYGQQLLSRVSQDLRQRNVPGCSPEMLGRMRTFYRTYPQLGGSMSPPIATKVSASPVSSGLDEISSPVTESGPDYPTTLDGHLLLQLPWSHLIELIRLDDPWKRAFYENECLKSSWSKRELQRQIGSLLYERTGLSTDKQAIIERARRQAAHARIQISELQLPSLLRGAGDSVFPRRGGL